VSVKLATLVTLWKGREVLCGLEIELSTKGDEHHFFLGGDGFRGNWRSKPAVENFFEKGSPEGQRHNENHKTGKSDGGGLTLEKGCKVNGVGLVHEIDPIGERAHQSQKRAEDGNFQPKSGGSCDDEKASDAGQKIDEDVTTGKLVDKQSKWVEAQACEETSALQEPLLRSLRVLGVPSSEDHPECEFGQTTETTAAENPLAADGVEIKKDDAGEKSDSKGGSQKTGGAPAEIGPDKERKKSEELKDQGEVPPRSVQIEKIVVDGKKAKTGQADEESSVHRLQTGFPRADEIDEMSEPVHRVQPSEATHDP
jgi:hypothetical protein